MQSLGHACDALNIPLGERRGKSDLARFSLDLEWARGACDPARSRAYPSPPMSGSPPLHTPPNSESVDRQQSTGPPNQDVAQSWDASRTGIREPFGGAAVGASYQQDLHARKY